MGGACQGLTRLEVKDQRHVGCNAAAAKFVCSLNHPGGEPTSDGLVGVSGVAVPVAHHHRSALERGLYLFAHKLGTRSLVKKQLALVAHVVIARIEQYKTNLLGKTRAAWIAQAHDLMPGRLQRVCQQFALSGLAAAVHAFEGNKESHVAHARSLLTDAL